MTIGKRIIVGFTCTLAITVALGAFAYYRLNQVDARQRVVVDDALPGLALSGEMSALTQEGMSLCAQHVLSDDEQTTKGIEQRTRAAQEKFDAAESKYAGIV